MYVPSVFAASDQWAAGAAAAVGFGHLVVVGATGITATPVPFLVEGSSLVAHLARPNDVWRAAPCAAMMLVPGVDAYVSPSVYAAKAIDGRVVPTWNYEAVYAHGQLVVHDDVDWLVAHVARLSDRHEARRAEPWSVADAPDGYVAQLARGIVGVELVVQRWEAKRKLSQNRTAADVAAVTAELSSRGGRAAEVADAMQTR